MRKLLLKVNDKMIQIWTYIFKKTDIPASSSLIYILLLSAALVSCGRFSDPTTRPSPLVSDTLQSGSHRMSITYSSPRVRARKIWDDLVPFKKIWRSGANEATIFETNQDLVIDGRFLPKGKYSVFTIPNEGEWTIIFNKEWDQWGAYGYDEKKDQLRLSVMPSTTFDHQEEMTFEMDSNSIQFRWETLGYSLSYELR